MPDFSVLPISAYHGRSRCSYESVHPALPGVRSTCDGLPGNTGNCPGHGGLLLLTVGGEIAPEGATLLSLI